MGLAPIGVTSRLKGLGGGVSGVIDRTHGTLTSCFQLSPEADISTSLLVDGLG
jgi:hypothetical protein